MPRAGSTPPAGSYIAPMNPELLAEQVAPTIGAFGTRWMLSKRTMARGAEMGYGPFEYYFCGRAGVLGNVPSSVVVATFGFFSPELLIEQWTSGCARGPLEPVVDSFVDACENSAAYYGGDIDWERLNALATRVVESAPSFGAPLFAAWRDRALLETGGARRGGLLLNALRELRGSAHLMAIAAAGIHPTQAVLLSGGVPNAELFGIAGPYPEYEHVRSEWEQAEQTTNAMVAPAFETLSESEGNELVELVGQFGRSFR